MQWEGEEKKEKWPWAPGLTATSAASVGLLESRAQAGVEGTGRLELESPGVEGVSQSQGH